jgi:hypothetical protein
MLAGAVGIDWAAREPLEVLLGNLFSVDLADDAAIVVMSRCWAEGECGVNAGQCQCWAGVLRKVNTSLQLVRIRVRSGAARALVTAAIASLVCPAACELLPGDQTEESFFISDGPGAAAKGAETACQSVSCAALNLVSNSVILMSVKSCTMWYRSAAGVIIVASSSCPRAVLKTVGASKVLCKRRIDSKRARSGAGAVCGFVCPIWYCRIHA